MFNVITFPASMTPAEVMSCFVGVESKQLESLSDFNEVMENKIKFENELEFNDRESAIDFLINGTNSTTAVKYNEIISYDTDINYFSNDMPKSIKKVYEKYSKVKQKLDNLQNDLFCKEFSNKKYSCKNCNSSLSISHIKSNYCPVCGADLRPESKQKRIKKVFNKLNELESLYSDTVIKENAKNANRKKPLCNSYWIMVNGMFPDNGNFSQQLIK